MEIRDHLTRTWYTNNSLWNHFLFPDLVAGKETTIWKENRMYSVFLIWNQGLSKRVQSTFRLDLSDGSLPFKRDKQNYFCRVFQLLWECWQQGWTGQSFFLQGGARQGKKSSGRGGVGARQGSKSSGRGGAAMAIKSCFEARLGLFSIKRVKQTWNWNSNSFMMLLVFWKCQ